MLAFEKLSLENIRKLSNYFKYNQSRSCDFTIGGMFIWRDFFMSEYAFCKNSIIFKHTQQNGCTIFSYPLGHDTNDCFDEITAYADENNIPLKITAFSTKHIENIKNHYTEIEIIKERDLFDYLYNADDIINLSGNKYRAQRNHINRFLRHYDNYKFEEINNNNITELNAFFIEHFKNAYKDTPSSIEDTLKAEEIINNYDSYGLIGGILRVNNDIIGFSIAEKLKDTLYIHIERALTSYHGSYAMLVNSFAKHYVSDEIKYINREDDAGDEGLRKSKMSYRPCAFVEKYCINIIK